VCCSILFFLLFSFISILLFFHSVTRCCSFFISFLYFALYSLSHFFSLLLFLISVL
jgi:hypothetical protein